MADLARRQKRGGYLSWSRFDDEFAQHPKVIGISDAAFRLHVMAICYASRHQTDGVLSADVWRMLGRRWSKSGHRLVNQLADVGLWEGIGQGGYKIHDYLDYHEPADELASKREAKREIRAASGRSGGLAKASKRLANDAGRSKPQTQTQTQTQTHKPVAAAVRAPADADVHRRAYNAWEQQSPGGILKPIADFLDAELESGTPVEWIERACHSAAENGGWKPKNYIEATLRRYHREGLDSAKKGMIRGRAGTDKILDPYADFKPLVPRGKPSSDAWGNPLADEQTSQTMDAVLPQKSPDELQGIQGTGDVSRSGGDG